MIRRIGSVLAAAALLAGCTVNTGGGGTPGDPPPPGIPAAISITPDKATLAANGTRQFKCMALGVFETPCTWKVQQANGGAISSAGLYTAPATSGVYNIVATSTLSSLLTATAIVTVTGGADPEPVPPSGDTWVTGYYAGWYWPYSPPQMVDMTAMTHFVFGRVAPGSGSLGGQAGAIVQGGGSSQDPLAGPGGGVTWEDYLIGRAHEAGTKALLMLGGDGLDGVGFLRSTTDELRPGFVKAVVDYLVEHDYDGVDVDWENELHGTPALGVTAEEARRRLKALITEIRAEANSRPRYSGENAPVLVTFPGYMVSINFPPPNGVVEPWQAEIAHLVDQYNLMSYGIGSAWSGDGWESWFSSPIFGASGTTPKDLDTTIKAYEAAGVPRNKVGIGIGFYGIYYGLPVTGPRQPTGANAFVFNDNALSYNELVRKGYLTHGTYHWDEVAQVGYRSYPDGYRYVDDPDIVELAGFLTYENEQSIAAKGRWVRQTGVGGTIIWTINYGWIDETQSNPLLEAVKQAFLED